MKKISVIIPVYNVELYIRECLESILEQNYENIEIILIDDGSTDNSGKICDEYKKNAKVKVIHKKNNGVSSARNEGISRATGEYILFVDSDDFWDKNSIDILVNKLQENDCVICGFKEKYFSKEIYHRIRNNDISLNKKNAIAEFLNNQNVGGYIFNKLFKKSIITSNNIKFNENIYMCEDMLFVTEYLLNCNNILFTNLCPYNYRMRKSSAVWNKNEKYFTIFDSYKKMIKLLENYEIENLYYKILFSYYTLSNNEKIKAKEKLNINYSGKYKNIIKSKKINRSKKIKLITLKYFNCFYKLYMHIKVNKLKRFE